MKVCKSFKKCLTGLAPVRPAVFIPLVALFFLIVPSAASAATPARTVSVSPEFQIPPLLRKRVAFWIDVFSKYGERHKIVHHRLYPQVIFGVLDFTHDAEEMDDAVLRKRMVADEAAALANVRAALLYLGAGNSPDTPLQQHIVKAMSVVRGGPEKYREVVDNDWLRTQTGISDKFIEALKRSGRYLHFIEDIFVNQYGLPKEVTRLPFIESTFNYEAVSSAGAAGLWQFMRGTGQGFGMRINAIVDERKDPIIASQNAAQYVKRAFNRLGSWPLAVTSYNHGITGVLRKMKEAGTNDLARVIESGPANPFGFASSNFWPELLAAVEIYAHYDRYFPGLELDEPLHLSERRLPIAMSIGAISRDTGVDRDSLRVANYALGKQVWEGKALVPAGYTLRVPHNYAVQLARAVFTPDASAKKSKQYVSSSTVYGGATYTVRKGDTILSIAKKYGTTVDKLVAMNKLPSKSVKAGQFLIVKESKAQESRGKWVQVGSKDTGPKKVEMKQASEKTNEGERKKESAKGPRTYTVAKDDTLSSIAKKYGVSVEALKKQNKLKGNVVKPGQILALS